MVKKRISLILVLLVCCAICYGAAVTSSPYDGTGWNTAAPNDEALVGNSYQELQDLRKGVQLRMLKEHELFASSSAGGVHKQGSARAFFQDAAPGTQVDGSAFDSNDLGSLWFDSNASIDNQFNVLTATTPTWTPISTEVIAVLLASTRQFANMVIVDANVGIGTTSPEHQFEIEFSTTTIGQAKTTSTNTAAIWRVKANVAQGDVAVGGSAYGGTTFGMSDSNSFSVMAGTGSDNFLIGSILDIPIIFGQNDNEVMRVHDNGYVGIGEAAPDSKLEVNGTIHATNLDGTAVNLTVNTSGQIIRDPSDEKFKTNVRDIDSALEKVLGLRGRRFDWKDNKYGGKNDYGLIAQEVADVDKNLTGQADYMSIKQQGIIALLVEAVKEQQETILILKWFVGLSYLLLCLVGYFLVNFASRIKMLERK